METSLRVLMLEDTESDAQLIIRQLRKAGLEFTVTGVSARDDYLAALHCGQLDLILSDYALPTFDGRQALALAQELCPDTPFIFVTGALGEERAIEMLKAGATDYVLKDRLARLVPAVRRALEEADERRRRREAEEWLLRRTAELEQANAELAEQRAQLQTLSRRLVEVQEAERAALSRDLHDTAAQALTAIAMGLVRLERRADQAEPVRGQVATLRSLTDQVVTDLRRLAVNLRPASLDRFGLVAAVEQYVTTLRQQNGLLVELRVDGAAGAERLAPETETALYRIIQEALSNVVRHAQARHVSVELRYDGSAMSVVVADDGVGCDVAEALSRGRLGLLGMRERAEMVGGAVRMESAPGAGVTVRVSVPLARASGEVGREVAPSMGAVSRRAQE